MHVSRLLERTQRLSLLLLVLMLAVLPVMSPAPAYAADITVDTTDDDITDNGNCTLREAIEAANTDTAVDACTAGSGDDTITLAAGTYELTIAGAGENANQTGDLDISTNITIQGDGAETTIIQGGPSAGNGIDRVFHITAAGSTVTINDVTVRYGEVGFGINGGGIYNIGTLNIARSTIDSNEASFFGGGIYNTGTLNVFRSAIINNDSTNAGSGYGGGFYNDGATATANIANSTISGNTVTQSGGALRNISGATNLTNVTITDNTAGQGAVAGNNTITIKGTIIAGNTDTGGTPDIYVVEPVSEGYNVIGNGDNGLGTYAGDGATDQIGTTGSEIDPLLDALTGNPPYYLPQAGSPALDTTPEADCTYVSSGTNPFFADDDAVTIDQRGTGRPQPAGDDCDSGASERLGVVLTIEKASPTSFVNAGDTIEYTITVANEGDLDANNAVISDTLPSGLTFVPGSLELNGAAQADPTLPTLISGLNIVASDQYTITFEAQTDDDLPGGELITNVAGISSDEVTEEVTDDDFVEVEAVPEIDVSKTASSSEVEIGEPITYTYAITNTGNVLLDDVGALDDVLGEVALTSDSLASGEAISSTLVYTPTEADLPGPLVNTVEVSGTYVGFLFDDTVEATDTISVSLTSSPGIAVLKTASVVSAQPGNNITYSYLVTNTGNVTLTEIVAFDDQLDEVPLNATTLAPGATATGNRNYTVLEEDLPGPLVNTVTVTGTTSLDEQVTAEDSASVGLQSGEDAPSVDTLPAQDVLSSTATLRAEVNPNGAETVVVFRLGTTSGVPYEVQVAVPGTLTGTVSQTVSITATGLTPDTTYFYIAQATSTGGSATGDEESFTTRSLTSAIYESDPAPGATLDVGDVVISTTATVDLVITEAGTADLTVDRGTPSISGPDADNFNIVPVASLPFTLPGGSGETRTITIACTPLEEGTLNATLTLTTNDPEQPTVSYPLLCNGVTPRLYLPIVLRNAGGN